MVYQGKGVLSWRIGSLSNTIYTRYDAYESVKKPQLVVADSPEWLLAERAIGVNIIFQESFIFSQFLLMTASNLM